MKLTAAVFLLVLISLNGRAHAKEEHRLRRADEVDVAEDIDPIGVTVDVEPTVTVLPEYEPVPPGYVPVPPEDLPVLLEDPATTCPAGSQFVDRCFDSLMDLVQADGGGVIPPDPHGAAGTNSVIAVTNTEIEARTKTGALIFGPTLIKEMFTGVITNFTPTQVFDPKIMYDVHRNRFVVVVLNRVVSSSNVVTSSNILVAVSRGNNPLSASASDWYFLKIDSLIVTGTNEILSWADYPGIVQSFPILPSIYYRLVLH
jgi:hypothetical protein